MRAVVGVLAIFTLGVTACAIGGAESLTSVDPIAFPNADAHDAGQRPSGDGEATPGKRDGGLPSARDASAGCGDGICNGAETCSTCRGDCGACAPPCGDGMCNGADTCATCPADCGACPPRCGDGLCNGTDTCTSCPADCGVCPPRCGDGLCSGDDTCATCAADCGMCPPPCGELRAERRLGHGEAIVSCDGRFTLSMQGDGNLVLYQGSMALWSTNTSGTNGQFAIMQSDGNFVLYGAERALWSSETGGQPGAWLALQTDGNLVVYNAAGVALWNSGSAQR